MTPFPALAPAAPEIFLAISALVLLMLGVFRGDGDTRLISYLTVGVLLVAVVLVLTGAGTKQVTFSNLFIMDSFGAFMKVLVLLGSALSVLISIHYIEREQMKRIEFPVLMLLATIGMLMMVSANDLISLYVGLELQSLALYVIAAFRRDYAKSSEAGLKYFVLGALSSGMLLYGASLIYGFAGTTNFSMLADLFTRHAHPTGHAGVGLVVGLTFIAAGLAFKISAVPFHMWTPDVYEGAPTPVTAFFAVAPKVAAVALFVRLLIEPFGTMVEEWRQIIYFTALASMVLGSFAAIGQTNIKRLMAYSSIGHIGFALVGLAAGTELGVRGVMFYMAIYIFMNIGTFGVILCMRQNGRMVEEISDLAGLSKTHPMLALAMLIFMFSMAGIPPAAGFFAKLFVFQAAIEAHLYSLAIMGVLASVVGAYYYLRIIKVMYFDEPVEPLDRTISGEVSLVIAGTSLFTLLFFFFPAPLLNSAAAAAASLFAG
jgi:NADH-quinone oxidoreductase subunit N